MAAPPPGPCTTPSPTRPSLRACLSDPTNTLSRASHHRPFALPLSVADISPGFFSNPVSCEVPPRWSSSIGACLDQRPD
jgi:hypothetical protein